jgi:DNA polymerase I-like protein with 3'-5' exonuclease and polymerase domains
MQNKASIYQKISNYTHENFDPSIDEDVITMLRNNFNIHLPQRSALNESLSSTASDHEIIELILEYRTMDNN